MKHKQARADVFAALSEIAPDVQPEQIPTNASLRELAEMDSLDFLTFVGALCDVLGADIPESDYTYLDTIDGAIAYLEQH